MQGSSLFARGRQAIERKLKRGQVRISFDIDDTPVSYTHLTLPTTPYV